MARKQKDKSEKTHFWNRSKSKVSSRNIARTEGGSPIVTTQIYALADGPGYADVTGDTIALAAVTADDDMYLVPVDINGKVPEEAIYARFLDVDHGDRRGRRRNPMVDLATPAATVHEYPEGGFTPEQMVATGWWAHPNESDIEGIDDPENRTMKPFEGTSGKKAQITKRIIFHASDKERKRIESFLLADFTLADLDRATRDGLIIEVGNPGKGCSGKYYGKQPGVPIPKIVYEHYADEDTVVHEFVHHLRAVDSTRTGVARSPGVPDENGEMKTLNYDTYRNMEESATVAEAAVRTREPTSSPSGYYQHIKGNKVASFDEIKALYDADRETLTAGSKGSSPQRGKRAVDRVNERYEDTSISNLRYRGKGDTAIDGYKASGAIKPKIDETTKSKKKESEKAEASRWPRPRSRRPSRASKDTGSRWIPTTATA